MNPVGVGLLVGASVFAWLTVLNVYQARTARWAVPKRNAIGASAATTLAAAWCLAIGLWLVVTR